MSAAPLRSTIFGCEKFGAFAGDMVVPVQFQLIHHFLLKISSALDRLKAWRASLATLMSLPMAKSGLPLAKGGTPMNDTGGCACCSGAGCPAYTDPSLPSSLAISDPYSISPSSYGNCSDCNWLSPTDPAYTGLLLLTTDSSSLYTTGGTVPVGRERITLNDGTECEFSAALFCHAPDSGHTDSHGNEIYYWSLSVGITLHSPFGGGFCNGCVTSIGAFNPSQPFWLPGTTTGVGSPRGTYVTDTAASGYHPSFVALFGGGYTLS